MQSLFCVHLEYGQIHKLRYAKPAKEKLRLIHLKNYNVTELLQTICRSTQIPKTVLAVMNTG